jgi:hypothetical protein
MRRNAPSQMASYGLGTVPDGRMLTNWLMKYTLHWTNGQCATPTARGVGGP